MKSIGILIPYFGRFPDWAELFFETLKQNSTIDFIIFTDCETKNFQAPNIIFHKTSFEDYVKLINSKLDFQVNPPNAYKLCDFRPLLGHIHSDIFKNYDFYGYTDIDLLFGDIRSFYTDEILSQYDVISTHEHRVSGQLALFRNNKKNRNI